jgi:hypothetical protein
MIVNLVDIDKALERLVAGEPAYEFETEDRTMRILGPACGFGGDYLKRLRKDGLYADNIEEARQMARARNLTIIGIWFVKS